MDVLKIIVQIGSDWFRLVQVGSDESFAVPKNIPYGRPRCCVLRFLGLESDFDKAVSTAASASASIVSKCLEHSTNKFDKGSMTRCLI